MMKAAVLGSIAIVAASLTGCVVAPLGPPYAGAAYPAPGYGGEVAYVAPAYPMPAPGYAWSYNASIGWGWHHPRRGWYRR